MLILNSQSRVNTQHSLNIGKLSAISYQLSAISYQPSAYALLEMLLEVLSAISLWPRYLRCEQLLNQIS
ncbi:hypothetical protein [Moorena bouillonii]|uniref:hypothetical protein n=1 Tax=Moorena bouillonii TaxID=207920 RepID=UPI00096A972F|nr:hypothetical protein [Moorena bouillonii]